MTGHESDRYRRHLLALARRLLRDADRAEDAVQQALLIAVQKDQREPGLLRWLETTTRYTASVLQRGHRRRERREKKVARPDRDKGDAPRLLDRRNLAESVGAALRSLREPYRSTIIMRFFDGLPPREIARALDVPVTTIDSRLQRGLAQLRVSLGVSELSPKSRTPKRSLRWLPLAFVPKWRPALAAAAAVVICGLGAMLFWQEVPSEISEQPLVAPGKPHAQSPSVAAPLPLKTARFSEAVALAARRPKDPSLPVPADYVLTGRVESNLGDPCVAAKVTVSHNGSNSRTAFSGADGRFSVGVVREPGIDCLSVQVEHGRLGLIQRVWQGPHTGGMNLGQLLLNPASCLEVLVSAAGAPVPNTRVRLELRDFGLYVQAAESLIGSHLVPVITDEQGVASWSCLPSGSYRIVAESSDGKRVAEHCFKHRAAEPKTRIDLAFASSAAREIEVVDRITRQPVTGLELMLQFPERADDGRLMWWADEGRRPLVTDHLGRCVLTGIPEGKRFRVTPACLFEFSNDILKLQRIEFGAHQSFGTLEITAPIRVQWPWPEGIEGESLLAWQFFAGMYYAAPVAVHRRSANVVIDGLDPRARAVMVQVDDHTLIWWEYSRRDATPEPPMIEPARHVEILVRDPGGSPIPDALVRVDQALPWHREWTVTTNEQGVARVVGLSEPEAIIKLTSSASSSGAPPLTKLLEAGEENAKLEFVLQKEVMCAIEIHVNGHKRMPGRPLLVKAEGGLRGRLIRDAANSVLRCQVWPYPGELEVRLRVQGPGLRDGVVTIPAVAPTGGQPIKAEAHLLDVVNVPLRVNDPTREASDFQVRRAGGRPGGDWDASIPWPPRISQQPEGGFLMSWLPPGEYCVMDLRGGRFTEFIIEPNSKPEIVDLDCGTCLPIKGHLVGAVVSADSTRVLLRSTRTGLTRCIALDANGSFSCENAEWPVVVQAVQLHSSEAPPVPLSNEVLLTVASDTIVLEAMAPAVPIIGGENR